MDESDLCRRRGEDTARHDAAALVHVERDAAIRATNCAHCARATRPHKHDAARRSQQQRRSLVCHGQRVHRGCGRVDAKCAVHDVLTQARRRRWRRLREREVREERPEQRIRRLDALSAQRVQRGRRGHERRSERGDAHLARSACAEVDEARRGSDDAQHRHTRGYIDARCKRAEGEKKELTLTGGDQKRIGEEYDESRARNNVDER